MWECEFGMRNESLTLKANTLEPSCRSFQCLPAVSYGGSSKDLKDQKQKLAVLMEMNCLVPAGLYAAEIHDIAFSYFSFQGIQL